MIPEREASVRRRIEFDAATWHALDRLAKDRMETFQELFANEASPTDDLEGDGGSLRSQAANNRGRELPRRGR